MWHIGGGHKKLYRTIDFKRNKFDVYATVERLEYDPNRTAFIALIKYEDDNGFAYIIAPQKFKVGNCLSLKSIPVGTVVHNVEMKPGKGGQLARSAGSSVQLAGKDSGYAQ